ncbi:MAG: methionyl-tRNA formyltransferase [Lachnospiraceae bacterium]|nr:methionyl-tRNA formyltransferase [Lachnospiraceae bacterium]
MRVVFMGTPDFAVGTLEEIIKAGHEVLAVFTQPDKPKGRGKAMQFPPVKETALAHDLTVYQPERVKDEEYVSILRELNPDVIVVVAFGQILSKEILDLPRFGCVNVHASLLPKYRGAAPIQWAVIDGEKESGVTTMLMNEGIDTGDMLKKVVVPLDEKETGGSLFDKLAEEGAKLLVETLVDLENGTATRTPQDHDKATKAKMLRKELGLIDFTKSAAEIERLIRGLNPWPSAYTGYKGKTLKIWDATVINEDKPGEAGQIVEVTKNSLIVKTGDGLLSLEEVQLEGKKRMEIDAFLRGNMVEIGTKLER